MSRLGLRKSFLVAFCVIVSGTITQESYAFVHRGLDARKLFGPNNKVDNYINKDENLPKPVHDKSSPAEASPFDSGEREEILVWSIGNANNVVPTQDQQRLDESFELNEFIHDNTIDSPIMKQNSFFLTGMLPFLANFISQLKNSEVVRKTEQSPEGLVTTDVVDGETGAPKSQTTPKQPSPNRTRKSKKMTKSPNVKQPLNIPAQSVEFPNESPSEFVVEITSSFYNPISATSEEISSSSSSSSSSSRSSSVKMNLPSSSSEKHEFYKRIRKVVKVLKKAGIDIKLDENASIGDINKSIMENKISHVKLSKKLMKRLAKV